MEVINIKKEDRKNELLNIAYELFITKGYENTSVDEIISKANIAKGTFYYYFKSKEETLENVIDMMINKELEKAIMISNSNMSVQEKLIGIILSMRPEANEIKVEETLNTPENIIMHNKVNSKIIEKLTPILAKVVEEGNKTNIFNCNNVQEIVEIILIITTNLFDDNSTKGKDMPKYIDTFVDIVEKILGAKKGTMEFIKKLIR